MSKTLTRFLAVLAPLTLVAAAPMAYEAAASHSTNPVGQIGTIALTERHLLAPDLIRAFVPTGSKNQRCLLTFSESTIGDALGPAPFCGARTVRGVDGILITVHLESPVDELYLSLTVFQQFAKGYGTPELYRGL